MEPNRNLVHVKAFLYVMGYDMRSFFLKDQKKWNVLNINGTLN